MSIGQLSLVIERLRHAVLRKECSDLTDAELLEHFIRERDEGAFSEIVQRYGSLVWNACQRILHNRADAEDAFQATFIVLARKASSIRSRSLLAGWLYGVARRAALKERRSAQRQAEHDLQAGKMRPSTKSASTDDELVAILDEEIQRLPEYYRTPIILCELEGLGREQAAKKLGLAEGTVASRVARGRGLLARRISAVGFSLAVALSNLTRAKASIPLPMELLGSTTRAALGSAVGATTQAVVLSERIIKAMLLTKLKWTTSLFLTFAALGALIVAWGNSPGTAAPAPSAPPSEGRDAAPKAAKDINLDLLQNEEISKEIGCTEEQKGKISEAIKEAHDEVMRKMTTRPVGGGKFVPTESTWRLAKKEVSKKIANEIMTEAQVKRLQQLELQSKGPEGLLDRKVVRSLRLTEAQEDTIAAIVEKAKDEQDESEQISVLAPGPRLDFKILGGIQEQATKEAVKVLTEGQKKTWQDLIGKEVAQEFLQAATAPLIRGGFRNVMQWQGGLGHEKDYRERAYCNEQGEPNGVSRRVLHSVISTSPGA